MLTSKQWWQTMKASPALFTNWLKDQYHGEMTAADRIEKFAGNFKLDSRSTIILKVIAGQERTHAEWVGGLLKARGISPAALVKEERYWNATMGKDNPNLSDPQYVMAVGAHAETMRLERIKAIAQDESAPKDVQAVFKKILPQEKFHARAFAQMAGSEALKAAVGKHAEGLQALGLAM